MANSEVIYVPIPGKNNCIYPTYLPIVMKEPEVYKATGRLSVNDYNSTVDNLGGNPALIPIIAALAPFIPSAIKGIKKLFKGNDNKPKYRNVMGNGYYSSGYYSQRGYHGLNENTYYKGGYPRVAQFNTSCGFSRGRYGGYIPTNPNIKNLKDLQALYDKYD